MERIFNQIALGLARLAIANGQSRPVPGKRLSTKATGTVVVKTRHPNIVRDECGEESRVIGDSVELLTPVPSFAGRKKEADQASE